MPEPKECPCRLDPAANPNAMWIHCRERLPELHRGLGRTTGGAHLLTVGIEGFSLGGSESSYRMTVYKADMFSWEEVLPPFLAAVGKDLGLRFVLQDGPKKPTPSPAGPEMTPADRSTRSDGFVPASIDEMPPRIRSLLGGLLGGSLSDVADIQLFKMPMPAAFVPPHQEPEQPKKEPDGMYIRTGTVGAVEVKVIDQHFWCESAGSWLHLDSSTDMFTFLRPFSEEEKQAAEISIDDQRLGVGRRPH